MQLEFSILRSFIQPSVTSYILFVYLAQQPSVGHGLLINEVSRSHTTTHHSWQYSSGRAISSSLRPLSDNTQHSQQTNIHASGGIRTHNPSRRAAADLHLRSRGHWDRHFLYFRYKYSFNNQNFNFYRNMVFFQNDRLYYRSIPNIANMQFCTFLFTRFKIGNTKTIPCYNTKLQCVCIIIDLTQRG